MGQILSPALLQYCRNYWELSLLRCPHYHSMRDQSQGSILQILSAYHCWSQVHKRSSLKAELKKVYWTSILRRSKGRVAERDKEEADGLGRQPVPTWADRNCTTSWSQP